MALHFKCSGENVLTLFRDENKKVFTFKEQDKRIYIF